MIALKKMCAAGLALVAMQLACAEVSSWTVGTDDAAYDETHVLSAEATVTIADEYGSKQVTPRIEFRCTSGGELGMRIDWARFISSFNTEAGFKVDTGKQNWVALGVDDSNKVTIVRSASDVQALVAALEGGETLEVEIVPYSEAAVTVGFNLGGFAESLASLREMCR